MYQFTLQREISVSGAPRPKIKALQTLTTLHMLSDNQVTVQLLQTDVLCCSTIEWDRGQLR